jgi:hypothetical protein
LKDLTGSFKIVRVFRLLFRWEIFFQCFCHPLLVRERLLLSNTSP